MVVVIAVAGLLGVPRGLLIPQGNLRHGPGSGGLRIDPEANCHAQNCRCGGNGKA